MKRVSKYLFVFLAGCLLVTGCSSTKEVKEEKQPTSKETQQETKTMSCTRTAKQDENTSFDLKYTVKYTGNYVNSIASKEVVTSNDTNVLNQYKTQVESIYKPYKDVDNYYYNVRIENNQLISETSIDYDKIDTDKMIEIDSANAQLIKDGKISINDLKTVYASFGITCK